MFGPDYEAGACPGCTSLADAFDGQLIHLNKRDVTFLCSRGRRSIGSTAYKKRMGWQFPYVSTHRTDFPFDFGLALTEGQVQQIPEVKEMIDKPPDGSRNGRSRLPGLKDGLRENPSYIAFARENGTIYHTYTVTAPDPFVGPYFEMLLERAPKPQPEEPRSCSKDEYPF